MLSLFRHATRRSVSAARPALVAHYSAPQSPQVAETTAMEDLQVTLNEQAENQESEKGSAADSSGSSFDDRPQDKWKTFKSGYAVKPHDFTYKARFNAPPTYQIRRPQVGPPASVARYNDIFHQLDVDPLDLSMDVGILSHYVSEMGKVYGRNVTGLTTKSQRRLGKAIRRAKMMGIIPVLSKSSYYTLYKSRK